MAMYCTMCCMRVCVLVGGRGLIVVMFPDVSGFQDVQNNFVGAGFH